MNSLRRSAIQGPDSEEAHFPAIYVSICLSSFPHRNEKKKTAPDLCGKWALPLWLVLVTYKCHVIVATLQLLQRPC